MQPESSEPSVFESELNSEQLEALFSDLSAGAEVLQIQVRPVSGDVSQDQPVDLADALQLLQSGRARAIQVRYRFEQQTWCDTLIAQPHSVRVIRSRLPESSSL